MSVSNTKRIGDIFIELLICDGKDIQQALNIQQKVGGRLGGILLNMGAITEDQLLMALSQQFEIPLFRSVNEKLNTFIPSHIEKDFLLTAKICPCKDETRAFLAVLDPLALESIARVELVHEGGIQLLLATEPEIDNLLHDLAMEVDDREELGVDVVFGDDLDKLKELASEAPVIKLVNRIISRAVEVKSSDIHFESFREKPRVRVRIDGLLKTIEQIPASMQLAVIARLKLISGMNIAESRLPQDGRISLRVAGKDVDIRASSVPTSFGESFVLRLLGKEDVLYSLESLGFYSDHLRMIRDLVQRPNGIFLTTGPTGSGKTTTLYSVLSELNQDKTKIITVEDPVEYELEGINQIHVREKIDYTFARALRAILRQDPDIIMIGEIRDRETAEIAVQSALTGHMVLSTLHTNNALASITRLLDMGIESFLLKASVVGFMAQRLVRKLCTHCAVPFDSFDNIEKKFKLNSLIKSYPDLERRSKQPVGCGHCNGTGYSGRIVIAEVVPFDSRLQKALDDDNVGLDLSHYNQRTLLEDGLLKFYEGKTSIDEVMQTVV